MKRLLSVLTGAALLTACPAPEPTPEDAGSPPTPEYAGETAGGSIPELPDSLLNPEPLIDAGVITIDAGCCDTRFHLAQGEEPGDATGRIESGLAVLRDRPLSFANGEWSANACFPLSASAAYRYLFVWDAGVQDAGAVDLEDGGQEWLEVQLVNFTARASEAEPTFTDVNGETWNFYRAVETCDGLDGSVP